MNEMRRFLTTPRYYWADVAVMAVIFLMGLCAGVVLAVGFLR